MLNALRASLGLSLLPALAACGGAELDLPATPPATPRSDPAPRLEATRAPAPGYDRAVMAEHGPKMPAFDETPPHVLSSSPWEGARDAAPSLRSIVIVFSESMDPAAGEAVLVGGPAPVVLTAVWGGAAKRATFAVTVSPSTDYRLALDGFTDAAGNPLDGVPVLGDGALDFRVEARTDVQPPRVVTSRPADNATDVPRDTMHIVVTFDEPMDSSRTEAHLFDVTLGMTSTLTGAWSDEDRTLSLFAPGLAEGRDYQLDLSAFTDAAGNPLDGSPLGLGRLDFRTRDDTTPPRAEGSAPFEGETGVPTSLTEIVVHFDEAIDPDFTEAVLESSENGTAFLVGEVTRDGRRVTYSLVEDPLEPGTDYELDLNEVRDLSGNPLFGGPYLLDGVLGFSTSSE